MKKRFYTLVFVLVACYCLSIFPMIFIGCANSSGGGSLPPADTVSSNIGAVGGEVGDDNAMISIPAGALDSETTITVKYISNKKNTDYYS